jgi:N-methylhydantoinase B/oxoprolinase/acetone carboxylase alpha subunit
MDNGKFDQKCILQTCKPTAYQLHKGDIVRYQSASAGGFGSPLERSLEMVREDV